MSNRLFEVSADEVGGQLHSRRRLVDSDQAAANALTLMAGVVLDASGGRVAGAHILGSAGERLAMTTSRGTFEISCSPEVVGHEVHVWADGFAPRGFAVERRAESTPIQVYLDRAAILEISLVADDGSIMEPHGIKIAVAVESIREGSSAPVRMSRGQITWESQFDCAKSVIVEQLPPNAPLAITVTRHGKAVAEVLLDGGDLLLPGEQRYLPIAIREQVVRGKLIDGVGHGVPQRSVYLVGVDVGRSPECAARPFRVYGADPASAVPSTVTDGDGVFQFEAPEPGIYWVGVVGVPDDDHRIIALCLTPVDLDSRPTEVVLPEWEWDEFRGAVVDESGVPVADAEVSLDCPGVCFNIATVRTDVNGCFRTLVPRNSQVALLVLKDGFAPSDTAWSQHDSSVVIIELKRACGVVGVVSSAGSPAGQDGRVKVFGSGDLTVSLPMTRGRFTVDGLPAGCYSFVVECDDGSFARMSDVQLDAGESSKPTIYLQAEAPAFLTLWPSGAAPSIRCAVEWDGDVIRHATLARGRRQVLRVPAGVLTLAVWSDDDADVYRETVMLAPGENACVGLEK